MAVHKTAPSDVITCFSDARWPCTRLRQVTSLPVSLTLDGRAQDCAGIARSCAWLARGWRWSSQWECREWTRPVGGGAKCRRSCGPPPARGPSSAASTCRWRQAPVTSALAGTAAARTAGWIRRLAQREELRQWRRRERPRPPSPSPSAAASPSGSCNRRSASGGHSPPGGAAQPAWRSARARLCAWGWGGAWKRTRTPGTRSCPGSAPARHHPTHKRAAGRAAESRPSLHPARPPRRVARSSPPLYPPQCARACADGRPAAPPRRRWGRGWGGWGQGRALRRGVWPGREARCGAGPAGGRPRTWRWPGAWRWCRCRPGRGWAGPAAPWRWRAVPAASPSGPCRSGRPRPATAGPCPPPGPSAGRTGTCCRCPVSKGAPRPCRVDRQQP